MKRTNTLIIGAGQAGLALSRCLTSRGIDHVIIERGRIAQRWAERWDSLRLLSPNWMTRLPAWRYQGLNPDGFMERDDVIRFLQRYASSFDAPVVEEATVLWVDQRLDAWSVVTDQGAWTADNVVIATGHADRTRIPAIADALPPGIVQMTTTDYRNPDQLPDSGVLVVGGSASGVQLARELARSGRKVVLSTGRHTRLPRRYRGNDILYWLDRIGSLSRPLIDMPDQELAKREPSLQLVGSDKGDNVDFGELATEGVKLAGRLQRFENGRLRFADDLERTTADAEEQLRKVVARIDRHISSHGLEGYHEPPEPVRRLSLPRAPRSMNLEMSGIGSVLWATGYCRKYPWLGVPLLDATGEIPNHRGTTEAKGLYVLGLQFMIRRNSSTIDGVGRDAEEIAGEIAQRAARGRREAA